MKVKRPSSDRMRGQHGFTLLEVMIALAIFAIGILAVSAMQISSINVNAGARMQTEATNVASDAMERLLALPYDHNQLDADVTINPHSQPVGAYTVEWTVTTPAVGDPVYGDMAVKMIDMTVSCANRNAQPVSLSFIKRNPQVH
jgi:prepilin-type N-terminal cleavage/methylation domain-containing protein